MLGTLLGDSVEMRRRKQLAAASLKNLWRIWSNNKNNKIGIKKRIQLYNAYITPILTYNACTWALTETELQELEIFRRKQLRSIVGIRYPQVISNAELYNKCGAVELQFAIRGARWRMLGHVLRMTKDTPAKHAMIYYFSNRKDGFTGRPRTTLPIIIDKDLKAMAKQTSTHHNQNELDIPKQLTDLSDMEKLETLANSRQKWKSIVTNMQVLELPKPKPKRLSMRTRENEQQ